MPTLTCGLPREKSLQHPLLQLTVSSPHAASKLITNRIYLGNSRRKRGHQNEEEVSRAKIPCVDISGDESPPHTLHESKFPTLYNILGLYDSHAIV